MTLDKLRWLSFVAGALLVLGVQPAGAEANIEQSAITQVPRLHNVKRPAMTVQEWISQTPSPTRDSSLPVQVTGVKLNPTDSGIEVVLETAQGEALQVKAIALGKSYIANIPSAVLALPQGQFRQDNPASGITRVTVTQTAANSIRVIVTGAVGVPTIELFDSPDEGLIFAVASSASSTQQEQQSQEPSTQTDQPIEILVTGEQEETGYSVPNASTATKTDTPLRDIPQSIQVVPQQVLEDRNVRTITEAVETVSGVADAGTLFGGNGGGARIIRGFQQDGNFRNGFRDNFDFYTLGLV